MRRRFAIVFNATAGSAIPLLLDRVLSAMRERGAEVFQLPARSAREATERVGALARDGGADAVIAAGGDGTYRAVAAGAAGSQLPVGVLPVGTGNIIAHEIGLRRRSHQIADVLIDGPIIETRGGLANGAPFFLMAGAGFDAAVAGRLNYRSKRAFARAAYVYPVLRTIAEGPQAFDVEIDGKVFEATWAIFALSSRFGGSFRLTSETQVGAEKLTAILIESRSRIGLLTAASCLALGRLADARTRPKGVRVFAADAARIGRRSSAPLEVDGDPIGHGVLEISSNGPRINLIVPDAYVADLTERHANRVA